MLIDLLVLVLAPLNSCDTARAAIGSCSSQLSSSTQNSSFQLDLSRSVSIPATTTPATSAQSAPVATQPVAPKPAATQTSAAAAKPTASATASPKPTSTPKPVSSSTPKPTASTSSSVSSQPAKATPACGIVDPPLARLYSPPCPAPAKPAPKPSSTQPAKPAATVVAKPAPPPAAAQVASPPVQTVSSPAQSTPARSYTERDQFSATVPTPSLRVSAPSARVGELVTATVHASAVTQNGLLLATPAEIRFTPIAAVISSGAGASLSNFFANFSFDAAGQYWLSAVVQYRVDYRLAGGLWVENAAVIASQSNRVLVEVLEPRKRSLLVASG